MTDWFNTSRRDRSRQSSLTSSSPVSQSAILLFLKQSDRVTNTASIPLLTTVQGPSEDDEEERTLDLGKGKDKYEAQELEEESGVGDTIIYQASSPDEGALVTAAKHLGYYFHVRNAQPLLRLNT